jgi:mono/diheme cytochrome c family protein
MRRVEVTLVIVGLLLFIGCAGESPEAPLAKPTAAEIARAVELYGQQACPECHGGNAEGVEDTGPALRELAPYWDVDRLVAYLADPDGFRIANPDFEERRDTVYELEMPAFDFVPEEDRRLLASWLLTR